MAGEKHQGDPSKDNYDQDNKEEQGGKCIKKRGFGLRETQVALGVSRDFKDSKHLMTLWGLSVRFIIWHVTQDYGISG